MRKMQKMALPEASQKPASPGEGSPPDHGLLVEEAQPKVKRPPLYNVLLLNDDYTPV